ncbi:MAG: hypothetical protein K2N76_00030 [Muribaculaceae bacterium]|nr:hypothetical protein [Muribaculaceae bacterium]
MRISVVFFTIIAAILITSPAYAKTEYLKQYAPGRQWIGEVLHLKYDPSTQKEYYQTTSNFCLSTVVGDTIIGKGKNKHKAKIIRCISSERGSDAEYRYVYENKGKTYSYNQYWDLTVTETDMSLKKGNKIKTYSFGGNGEEDFSFTGEYIHVTNQETINVKDIDRKKLSVSHIFTPTPDHSYSANDYWIEGIGAFYGVHICFYSFPAPISRINYDSYCPTKFFDGDKCVFTINDYDPSIIYDPDITLPQIPSSIDETYDDSTIEDDMPIYDLMGRRVENPKKGHLYIKGSEKIIW